MIWYVSSLEGTIGDCFTCSVGLFDKSGGVQKNGSRQIGPFFLVRFWYWKTLPGFLWFVFQLTLSEWVVFSTSQEKQFSLLKTADAWNQNAHKNQYCWWLRNLKQPVDIVNISSFNGFYTCWVCVWNFFHQQYDLFARWKFSCQGIFGPFGRIFQNDRHQQFQVEVIGWMVVSI